MPKLFFYLFNISILKTLYFNLRYFGLKGLNFPILIGKRVELRNLGGCIKLNSYKMGIIYIGINEVGIVPRKNASVFQNFGTITFSQGCNIGTGVCISNHGELFFGENVSITANSAIICYKKISIGDNSLISWNCTLMDSDLHKIYSLNSNEQININKSITIGKHCWICSGATIFKGVHIDDNNIIAANSIIHKSVKGNNLIIGNENKLLKENISWKRF